MLQLKNIEKKYNDFHLKDITFSVEKGDYFILLGESGAGKSIILEIIAGLINPDKGSIINNGNEIVKEKIQNRKIGLVFQDYAVFPHLKVKDNIAYPIRKNKNKKEVNKTVYELAQKLNIDHLLNRKPTTLSGGELQRVALARTLALNPDFLLLDEPLSSLDVQLKNELRAILRQLNDEGISIIHVTHDYEEAISLANKIGIVHKGEIIQIGTPKEVFHNPKSKFVAHFTGIRNFYNASFISNDKVLLENKVEVTTLPIEENQAGFAFFRAEDVILSDKETDSSITNNFKGVVIDFIPTKHGIEVIIDIGIKVSAIITQKSAEKYNLSKNCSVWTGVKASAIRFVGTDG